MSWKIWKHVLENLETCPRNVLEFYFAASVRTLVVISWIPHIPKQTIGMYTMQCCMDVIPSVVPRSTVGCHILVENEEIHAT